MDILTFISLDEQVINVSIDMEGRWAVSSIWCVSCDKLLRSALVLLELSSAYITQEQFLLISNVVILCSLFAFPNVKRIIFLTLQTLSVDDVQLLLGTNIPDLKTFENQTQITNWISRQLQSELNHLNLGIQGGRADPIPTGVGVINTTATATGGATTAATNVTTTGKLSPLHRCLPWELLT